MSDEPRRRLIEKTTAERFHLDTIALAVVAFVPLLLTKTGLLADDTKIYLYLDPGHLVATAIALWNNDFAFGTVTHQNIGYLFPMGPFFWLAKTLAIPMWIAQRLWMGSLLFLAALGIWRFAREVGLSRRAGWLAAWPYMLTPFILVNLDRTSALLMPWAGLGWMMLFTLRAARRGDWRNPALFAVVVALVGGVNATSIVMVAAGPLLYLVYAAHSHEVTWKRSRSVIYRIGALSLAVSVWWLAGLWAESRYGINVLKYTESFGTVSLTSTSSESLRGLGYWYFYGWDQLQPWTLVGFSFVSGRVVPAMSFVAPVAGVLAALLIRWRYRTLAVISAFTGVVIAVGAYPFVHPTPYGWVFKWFADHTTIALAMRSSNRVLPVMIIWLCLLVGAGYDALRHRNIRLANIGAAIVTIAALLTMLPLLEGKAIASNLTFPSTLPLYVQNAARTLNQGSTLNSVLGLPGQDFAYYRYGTANDSIWPAIVTRPWISSQVAPEGEPASSNLIRSLDATLQNNIADAQSIVPIGRLFSSSSLLVQMDQQYERFGTPTPAYMWQLLSPTPDGMKLVGTYGPRATLQAINGPFINEQILGLPLNFQMPQSLAVYAIGDPRSLVRTESLASPQVVAGDGEGLVTLGALGLLDHGRAIYYDAALSRTQANQLASEPGAWLVLTDSNQKRTDTVGTLSATQGYVQTANEQPLVTLQSQVHSDLFPNQSTDMQTVAVMKGLSEVGASAYGNIITNNPEVQPYMAVDGLINTAWQVASFSNAIGQYWQMTANETQAISRLHFVQVQSITQNRFITKIGISINGAPNIVENLAVSSRTRTGQDISIPSTHGRTIRVTILGVTGNDKNLRQASSVGFAEVDVPGFGPVTRGLLAPTSLLSAAGPGAATDQLTVVFNRLRVATHPTRLDPELALLRYFVLPFARQFTVSGFGNINPAIGDDQLDVLLGRHPGPGVSVAAVEGSTTLTGSLYDRAWGAFDNDPATGWAPRFKVGPGEWIRARLTQATTLSNFSMSIVNDGYHMIPTQVRVSNGTTSELVNIPIKLASQTGRINRIQTVHLHIYPLRGNQLTFTFTRIKAVPVYDRISGGVNFPSFNIESISMPGVSPGETPSTFNSGCRNDLLFVNHVAIPAEINGSMNDALAQKRLRLTTCSPSSFILQPGTQTVSSGPGYLTGLNVNNVELDSAGTNPGPTSVTAPLTASWHGRVQVNASVPASLAGHVVVLGQSYSNGWHAILGGHDLGTPTLVDGASMGWRLPSKMTATTPITFVWQPQRIINLGVVISALSLLVALAMVVTNRPRRRANTDVFDVDDDEPVWGGFAAKLNAGPTALFITALAASLAVSLVAVPIFLILATLWMYRRDLGRFMAMASGLAIVAAATITIVATQFNFVHDISWPEHVHWANTAAWIALALWVLVVVGNGTLGDGGSPHAARTDRPPKEPRRSRASRRRTHDATPAPTWPTPEHAGRSAAAAAAAAAGALSAPRAEREALVEPQPSARVARERRRGLNVARSPEAALPDEAQPTLIAPRGFRRTMFLTRSAWRLRHDPEAWHAIVAQDVMSQISGRTALFNRRVLDIADTVVPYQAELIERGSHVSSMRRAGSSSDDDAVEYTNDHIPAANGQFDLVFATNVLSSVPDPAAMIAEIVRVTRHGGTIYIQNRMWASPWGGYESSPWHLLGGARARRRYVKRHHAEPEHRYGENLFRLTPAKAMKLLRANPELTIFIAGPRVLPTEWTWTLRVPLLRSLLVEDLVVVAERH